MLYTMYISHKFTRKKQPTHASYARASSDARNRYSISTTVVEIRRRAVHHIDRHTDLSTHIALRRGPSKGLKRPKTRKGAFAASLPALSPRLRVRLLLQSRCCSPLLLLTYFFFFLLLLLTYKLLRGNLYTYRITRDTCPPPRRLRQRSTPSRSRSRGCAPAYAHAAQNQLVSLLVGLRADVQPLLSRSTTGEFDC
eukprot:9473524-Pyramimonas_sp.AAC.1